VAIINQAKESADALESSLVSKGLAHKVVTERQTIASMIDVICEKALDADLAILPAEINFTGSPCIKTLEGILFESGLHTIALLDQFTGSLQMDKLLVV